MKRTSRQIQVRPPITPASVPERSGMWISCFHVGMKVVLNVKVSCTVGVGANQNPAGKTETEREIQKCQSESRTGRRPLRNRQQLVHRDAAHELLFFLANMIKEKQKDKKASARSHIYYAEKLWIRCSLWLDWSKLIKGGAGEVGSHDRKKKKILWNINQHWLTAGKGGGAGPASKCCLMLKNAELSFTFAYITWPDEQLRKGFPPPSAPPPQPPPYNVKRVMSLRSRGVTSPCLGF